MKKHSKNIEDEIPLTHTSPIIQETRAKFDSLLRAALKETKEKKKKRKKIAEHGDHRKQSPHKLSSIKHKDTGSGDESYKKHESTTELLTSGIGFLSSSEDEAFTKNQGFTGIQTHEKSKSIPQLNDLDVGRPLVKHSEKLSVLTVKSEAIMKEEIYQSDIFMADVHSNENVSNDRLLEGISNSPLMQFEELDKSSSQSNSDSSRNKPNPTVVTKSLPVFKKPVPLPRIKVGNKSQDVKHSVKYKSSEDDSDSTSRKDLVVHALVSATDSVPAQKDFEVSQSDKQRKKHKHRPKSQTVTTGNAEEIEMDDFKHSQKENFQEKESSSTAETNNGKKKIKRKKGKTNSNFEDQIENELEMRELNSSLTKIQPSQETLHELKPPKGKHERSKIETEMSTASVTSKDLSKYSYEKIIGITVHRSDCLQPDVLVRHPLVKVHLIDVSTGEYLKKSDKNRPVSFFYENKVEHILPLMTEIFDFRERRCIIPFWEELLVFNEDIEYLYKTDPPVVILFEILDFVNFSVASSQYKKLGSEGGWHKIAWAFLKPVGKNGVLNTEHKVRLQLYKPQNSKIASCDSCDPYVWWSRGRWDRYPGTLYVTVKGILPPEHLHPALRSRSALQGEHSSCNIDMEREDHSQASSNCNVRLMDLAALSNTPDPSWSRLPSQSCKVPNNRRLALPTTSKGCFSIKFNHSGRLLSCAMATQQVVNIIIYTIPEGKEHKCLTYHQGLVYDLHWSKDDSLLLSASADCTACVWDMEAKNRRPSQMLPHPSFVYCAHFHPKTNSVLATGCFDHVVRLWSRAGRNKPYELFQELEGHVGFVNSLCFNKQGKLISGDSLGRILIWVPEGGKSKKHIGDWKLESDVKPRELKGTVINKLMVHPGGQRLLVHARDSLLRMLDLATGSVIQWFKGALNHTIQTLACISPCGGLVFAASEDGTVSVWNADTGDQVALYAGLGFQSGATGVDYHPHEHMVAFSLYGVASRVIVCDYKKSSTGKDVGLEMLVRQVDDGIETLQHVDYNNTHNNINRLSLRLKFDQNKESALKKTISSPNKFRNTIDFRQSSTPHTLLENSTLPYEGSTGMSSFSPTTHSFMASTCVNDSPVKSIDQGSSDVRLSSIIEKMDQVLSVSSSRTSNELLESPASINIVKNQDGTSKRHRRRKGSSGQTNSVS
uniref:Jouberin n=1 Tax=Timema shepardi TaxID=629360 RepID=A0A7R9AZN0_TIMSH|nr:unnamed protein product [Timema shepardi]